MEIVFEKPTEKDYLLQKLITKKWLDPQLVAYYLDPHSVPLELNDIMLFISAYAGKKNIFGILKQRNPKLFKIEFSDVLDYPLHCSVIIQNNDLFNIYLKNHIDQSNSNGETPIMVSIKNGFLNTAIYLKSKGANSSMYMVDYKGNNLLHHAVYSLNIEIVKLFEEYYMKNYEGNTPLHFAVILGNEEITDYLLSKHPKDINLKGVHTPLDYAILERNKNMIKFLIKKGADITPESVLLELEIYEKLKDEEHFEIMKLLS